jgi:endonuclease-3 related protein
MRPTKKKLLDIYLKLWGRYGPQGWWPGKTKTEIMVGAVLTQNTAWKNVVKALDNIKHNKILNIKGLYNVSDEYLAQLLKPSGYYHLKAKRLKNLVRLWKEGFGNNWLKVKKIPTQVLRKRLLEVNGIGDETADSILLYALDRPVFVVDLYTKRLLTRHKIVDSEPRYKAMQVLFHKHLPRALNLYNEYHALIVKVGHEHCRKMPQCKGCPLEDLLPNGAHRSR